MHRLIPLKNGCEVFKPRQRLSEFTLGDRSVVSREEIIEQVGVPSSVPDIPPCSVFCYGLSSM